MEQAPADLVKYMHTCFPHGAKEIDVEEFIKDLKDKEKRKVYSDLVREFVPMGDNAHVAALMYQGLGGPFNEGPEDDSGLPSMDGDPVQVCKRYLEHMLESLQALYENMDMTPRAMMLNWALKGALQDKPRSYGEDNCRYWNPVEAVEHDFCYELYLEKVQNFVD
jgi:hypothetical protein